MKQGVKLKYPFRLEHTLMFPFCSGSLLEKPGGSVPVCLSGLNSYQVVSSAGSLNTHAHTCPHPFAFSGIPSGTWQAGAVDLRSVYLRSRH